MIWFLLLYVLPFFIGCILGYKGSKKFNETKGDYLKGVFLMLVPLLSILFILYLIILSLKKSKTIKNIKEYLKQPL